MAYSEDQISTAVALYAANGQNASATRRQLEKKGWEQVPCRKSIVQWHEQAESPSSPRERAVGKKSHVKKGKLADELEEIAWTLAGDLADEEKRQNARLSEVSTALGTVIDKMRLLRGEVTERTEGRSGHNLYQMINEHASHNGRTNNGREEKKRRSQP